MYAAGISINADLLGSEADPYQRRSAKDVIGQPVGESCVFVIYDVEIDSDDFCLHTVGTKPGRDRVTTGAHIAFRATDAGSVARWHEAALRNGGTDIGPPGLRPEYSGNYYAAFVLDPDGNNVEAVFHTPTEPVAA